MTLLLLFQVSVELAKPLNGSEKVAYKNAYNPRKDGTPATISQQARDVVQFLNPEWFELDYEWSMK